MTQPGEDLHELDSPRFDSERDVEAPEADAYEQALPADREGLRPEAAGLWDAVRAGTVADWVAANPGQVD